ncbi:MAG: sel1 repeat family protein [Idiomarina sp.]|nr:sel1 repeat family protein [Idiomarina sp.]
MAALPLLWATTVPAQAESCDTAECKAQMQKLVEYARYGNAEALAIIAVAYATGDGLEKDEVQARRMLRESIRLNSGVGMYVKSKWRASGFIFEQDQERAEYFLRRSAEYGHEPASYKLAARSFEAGPEQVDEGIAHLNKAAKNGYIPAQYTLARMMEDTAHTTDELMLVADIYVETSTRNYRDSRQRLNATIARLENELNDDHEGLTRLRQLRDMEVIHVSGQEFNIESSLQRVTSYMAEGGYYDRRTTGSRIRRQRPCYLDAHCRVVTPHESVARLTDLFRN